MSTFPTSETFQARWYLLPRRHEIHPPFLPLYQTGCGLQEGQSYNHPLRDKNSDVVHLSPLSQPSKDKLQFNSDFERCGHTCAGYANPCMAAQGDDITQLETGLEKGNTSVQKGVPTTEEHWTGLGQNTFEGSLQAPELVSRSSDFLTKPVKYREHQLGDFLIMNNCASAQLLAEANEELKEQGNGPFDNVHGNTIAPKQTSAAMDRKEMRARRNRESARRSRMKSKQHFQRMEETFVLMRRENQTLLVLVETLLPNYIARFPYLTAKLQSLFEIGHVTISGTAECTEYGKNSGVKSSSVTDFKKCRKGTHVRSGVSNWQLDVKRSKGSAETPHTDCLPTQQTGI